ncbi:YceI family protein [Patiriisocius hiemis]|uniref:YceI family protein n=1 Tax=Patiriisocius hiemis TaxID=3075604 RepID=A0ABU2YG22_9FLAO|nr:YceI family protein [Constantimarinum sp. W242]MDT0555988.1 YceI family protein [Constantimarinum sp. W242]
MKSIVKTLLVLAVTTTTVFATTTPIKKKINIKESSIEWKGKKVLGSHTGTIQLKEGYLEMDGNKLTGGMFVVDMTSINVTDLEGDSKGKLEGHLKSDDFFGTASHPTATLLIKKATKTKSGFEVTADITIKDTTEEITFILKMKDNTATTSLKIDRTKFGVRYGSGSFFDNLGDNTISDNFELDVTLKF